ncbi:hypothetical protein HOK00_01275 [bacterium]|jgi:hypothetical protein|nr:hypothetical protein [bacterium]
MKVVILAADSYEKIDNSHKPSCYSHTIGSISLIEYQLRLLNLLGYKYNDITIVTGKSGVWKNKSLSEIIKDNEINEMKIENNHKRSFNSLKSYLLNNKRINDLLILNSDSYFELKDLEKLIHPNNSSKILVESRNNLYSNGIEVFSKKSLVTNVLSNKIHNCVPWDSYYGSTFLAGNDINKLRDYLKETKEDLNLPYLETLVNKSKISLIKIDINKANSGIKGTSNKTMELEGGSFAGLNKMTLVKKYSDKEGNDKLVAEIDWLNNLPEHLKNKFISVVDYHIGSEKSWFTMPWYDLENLRKKIITGKFSINDTIHYIKRILDYMFENIYPNIIGKAEKNWIYEKHFDRVLSRFDEIQDIKPFDKILGLKTISINGKEYMNLPVIINELKKFEIETNFFQPKDLVMVHGDLHFQNMLIDSEHDDFILADPRGEVNGSDIYYDMGKLWHSINGLYDLIHTDISRATILEINNDTVHFDFYIAGVELIKTYSELKIQMTKLMNNYPIVNDKDWLLKTKFTEAMHFSSLMYFHLKYDGVENRALSLYLQGTILATKVLEEVKEL